MTAATAASSVHQRIGAVWKLTATTFLVTTVSLIFAVFWLMRPASEPDIVRFALPAPEKTVFTAGGIAGGVAGAAGSVSPDGRKLAFTAQDATGKVLLWIRSLDSARAQSLPNTEGAGYPFWSPDSRWIGFFAQGKLKKIDITVGIASGVV